MRPDRAIMSVLHSSPVIFAFTEQDARRKAVVLTDFK